MARFRSSTVLLDARCPSSCAAEGAARWPFAAVRGHEYEYEYEYEDVHENEDVHEVLGTKKGAPE
jgi:hypothetical protein